MVLRSHSDAAVDQVESPKEVLAWSPGWGEGINERKMCGRRAASANHLLYGTHHAKATNACSCPILVASKGRLHRYPHFNTDAGVFDSEMNLSGRPREHEA
jgi:hypothetical protein